MEVMIALPWEKFLYVVLIPRFIINNTKERRYCRDIYNLSQPEKMTVVTR